MKIVIAFILSSSIISCHYNGKNVIGKYKSVDPAIKSELTLQNDGKFIYIFERDSFCSGEVKGEYNIDKNLIKFHNDYEFSEAYHQKFIDSLNAQVTSNDTASYDIGFSDFDMSLVDWKISANSIKPNKNVETNCFDINSRHVKTFANTR